MELDVFLAPIEGGNPSGSELRNDTRFHAIERAIEPATRAQRLANVAAGGTGAMPVDWAAVLDQGAELAATGRDLRLLLIVVRALVNIDGFAGLADGLSLMTETVKRYWDSVHPELRPGPSIAEAAQRRTNALKQMQNVDTGVLGDLEFAIIFSPRGLPVVTGGDLAVAAVNSAAYVGEAFSGIGAKEVAAATAGHDARVQRVTTGLRDQADKQAERMAQVRASVALSRTRLTDLESALTERVGENGVRFGFADIDRFLTRVAEMLGSFQGASAESGGAMAEHAAATGEAAIASPQSAPTSAQSSGALSAAALPGRVTSRADVEKLLGLIIDYYDRTEPSSPIPHMAARMKKMVQMNFMQLMEELAPSGIKEFKTVAGVAEEKK